MTISDGLALASVILTGIYVGFTLWLVIITRRSLALAREQVNEAKEQARQDREESAKQSQAALEASAKQSQDAIEVVHEQIRASEQQARVALYNQHMPVLVPIDDPISSNAVQFSMHLENRGPGVALNAWGFLTMKGLPLKYHFVQVYFLVPDREAQITFDNGDIPYPTDAIAGHSLFPPVDTGGFTTNGVAHLPVDVRLTVTYNDVFKNKYLVIFDHIDGLGWRQDTMEVIKTRLDEML